ncbi:ubiquitin-like domain-containing protein CIP73 isoform X4 [Rhododendron vialii]|uniref:ubiquitin-like domain-containing protein CIP73 isoform X4 n=1 Tax=Rhododendron vialii TaxID=182163 RepID=UPI0026604608|nr:ubiquitin-like domain-containing protein CIP73 isoform X4 [Rhododendron vialii]
MGSNGCDEVMISGSNECSEATVEIEIKIKTLDSQTYTLRVDKCVPIPALKEQIATVTGVLSEQQRLICRGKVLKDDQLLSAYHVEDGHTLHMVVRQPMLPPLGSTDHPGTDPASSSSQGNQGGPSVVLGSFNISEQGDGVLPDFGRIVSAVLGSFGITNFGSGNEGADLREAAPEGLSRIPFGGLRNSNGQQTDQPASRGQSDPRNVASSFATSVPLEDLHPPVIPDSVTTLSQYLTRMRQEFSGNVRGQSNNSQAAGTGQDYDAAIRSAAGRGGLPTPASLAEVMLSTRQILTDQAADCLSQLTRQLEDQANMTDPLARTSIQSNAMRSGVLLQNLGALLLELGRTTMTLRMGQTPGDAVVNAGPAVFISTSGPNPIMVQPLPFQPGTSFGAIPMGAAQPGLGSLGSGFLPRNIDIRIRTANAPGDATQNGQGYSTQIPSGLDQLLRSIFPGVGNISFQRMDTSSAAGHMGPSQGTTTTQEAAPGEAAPRAGDEGIFLSNLLRQIMPIISQNTEIRSSSAPPEAGSETMDTTIRASSTQAQENSDRGTLSDRRGDPPSPSSKRQRRE